MNERLLGSLAIAVVAAVGVASAAKPPKAQDLLAATTFRCYAGDVPPSGLCGLPVSDGTDRFRDDGAPYPSATGHVQTSGFYWFHLEPTDGRSLNLRLGDVVPGSRLCETALNCSPDYDAVVGNLVDPIPLDDVSIEVKPVVGTNDLPGLLWGMTCGNPTDAIVQYTFWLPSGNGHWGFNFNQRAYPNTTNAAITRDSNLQWTVVSKMTSIGELLSWGHTGLRRPQSGPSREGLYSVNFKFTIVASGTPVSVCTS